VFTGGLSVQKLAFAALFILMLGLATGWIAGG
jgi:hypothetical protein